jgi:hypothetical protein
MLAILFFAVALYTGVTIIGHGPGLLPVVFGDIARMSWPGQFDLDFMCLLALSALWVAWRHRFSAVGFGLAVVAFFGGTAFLSLYLVVVSLRAGGDMSEILLGESRVAG